MQGCRIVWCRVRQLSFLVALFAGCAFTPEREARYLNSDDSVLAKVREIAGDSQCDEQMYPTRQSLETCRQSAASDSLWVAAWEAAVRSGKSDDYHRIIAVYPTSKFRDIAISRYEALRISETLQNGSESSILQFITEFPNNPAGYQMEAHLEASEFESASKQNKASSWFRFLVKYPDSPHLETAKEGYQTQLRSEISKHQNPELLDLFASVFHTTAGPKGTLQAKQGRNLPEPSIDMIVDELNRIVPDWQFNACARKLSAQLQPNNMSRNERLKMRIRIDAVYRLEIPGLPWECSDMSHFRSLSASQWRSISVGLRDIKRAEGQSEELRKLIQELTAARILAENMASNSAALLDEFESEELAIETLRGTAEWFKDGKASEVMKGAAPRAASARAGFAALAPEIDDATKLLERLDEYIGGSSQLFAFLLTEQG